MTRVAFCYPHPIGPRGQSSLPVSCTNKATAEPHRTQWSGPWAHLPVGDKCLPQDFILPPPPPLPGLTPPPPPQAPGPLQDSLTVPCTSLTGQVPLKPKSPSYSLQAPSPQPSSGSQVVRGRKEGELWGWQGLGPYPGPTSVLLVSLGGRSIPSPLGFPTEICRGQHHHPEPASGPVRCWA